MYAYILPLNSEIWSVLERHRQSGWCFVCTGAKKVVKPISYTLDHGWDSGEHIYIPKMVFVCRVLSSCVVSIQFRSICLIRKLAVTLNFVSVFHYHHQTGFIEDTMEFFLPQNTKRNLNGRESAEVRRGERDRIRKVEKRSRPLVMASSTFV
jgi:hypothetical protein